MEGVVASTTVLITRVGALPDIAGYEAAVVECTRRRDGRLFNFLALGRNALRAIAFLDPGYYYTLDHQQPPHGYSNDYDGEIISMNRV
jgi:hypothetical protein